MDSGKKEYTFFWFIENYSYCWHKNGEGLYSPYFRADGLEGTSWSLRLCPRGQGHKDKDSISLFLHRAEKDDGPDSTSITFQLSFLAADGSPLRCLKYNETFKKGKGLGFGKFLALNEIFKRNVDYLPQDILIVRCKIRKGEGSVIHNIGQCSARTRIKVTKNSFLHAVERFSTLQPNVKKTIKIRSHSKKGSFISCSLHFTEGLCCEEKIMIEIAPSGTNQTLRKCELYLLDGSGNEIECCKADNRYDAEGKNINTLCLTLTRTAVLNRKCEYLPDDKFSLLCNCTFSSGLEFQTIEEIVHEMPLTVKLKSNAVNLENACKTAEKMSTYPSLLEDIKSLYINKSLSDFELKTKTKSFRVHKNVLYARSPVFKAMMRSDMREKRNNSIQVDDLGDGTVHQLLLFLYSDTAENLEWGIATQLYYAADKYQVGKLKEVCSSFLVKNLTPTNAGELLQLADTHSDDHFKRVVEDFILKHEKEVFVSEQWENLMKENPQLAMKTMHLKYKR